MGVGVITYRFHIVRMNTRCGINKIELLRKLHRSIATFNIATNIQHILDPCFTSSFDNSFAIFLIIGNIDMCMGVDNHRTCIPCPGSWSNPASKMVPTLLAASTIPWDSMPINFAGLRLATITTVRPIKFSGS